MEQRTVQQSDHEMPASMRGDAPADLHVYSDGRRMSRNTGSARRKAAHMTASIKDTMRNVDQRGLATALGWFSIALGVAELVAPRQLGRAIGFDRNPGLMRAMGLREITAGVGILATDRRRTPWLWSRVAGDALDIALLGAAMSSGESNRGRLAAATAAVAGVTALDIYASQRATRTGGQEQAPSPAEPVREMITIAVTPEECYRLWRDVENLPRFMTHLESVQKKDDRTSHWVVKAPGGGTAEWDSEITADEPNAMLAWRSLPGADVENSGSVRFEAAPGGRGTTVRVEMSYVPPAGKLGAVVAKVSGEEPRQQVREDLRRFKQLLETGEITTTQGQPSGKRSVIYGMFRKRGME